ncbi:MAG: endonuclease [Rhodocyclaceae bacterium]|jgi:phosphatidylserine/phosphatidylglycerophosphate/cardiolipin synthase-like enzyme|uniref:phospholipase D n=1 Tax=Candidatus Desulfobacillus denitrificans TaxID=2608985 RepID=A0A809S3P5_9PROT|nr:phospholipase D family protein [Rhodocyclaceae bacterium]BBO20241.1 phospholipase D family protein [Candidatus Desulfobacillus denitrificans]GIK44687.1 MAG: endonuclease [Betaproteobacteria bacterium]GJQ54930.1 MAG: endonuclease [Rhodocyclaceae bacterium]
MKRLLGLLAVLAGLTFLAAPARAFDPRPATALAAQGTVEVLFAPEDDVEAAILRVLRGARRSVHVQAFLLTSRGLAAALIATQARGVQVEVLADGEQTARAENSQIPLLAAAGIPVALEVRYAAAHNKIILVDAMEADGTVVTGSYNFTWSARTRNAENVLILRGNPVVLRAYLDNWKRHRAEAVPYEANLKPGD